MATTYKHLRCEERTMIQLSLEQRAAFVSLAADPDVNSVAIEFSAGEYLDSSPLGILPMLRENLSGASKGITLAGFHGNVKQVLDIANVAEFAQIR